MIVLGLTGSIGMGKSTAADMFRRLGVPVFDADMAVRALQGPGGSAIPEIEAALPGMTGPDGIERRKLSAAAFKDPAILETLEAILHPKVRALQLKWLMTERLHRRRLVVLDIPLLFEGGGDRLCHLVAVVSAPSHVQRARVMARPGMTAEKFRSILARQMPDAEKRALADVVIPTGLGRRLTFTCVRRLVEALR